MKITGLRIRARSIGRYRDIFGVLLKYGFDEILDWFSVEDFPGFVTRFISRRRGKAYEQMARQKRLRLVVEELGPTFIKLGQMLSSRPDLLPPEYVAEFRKLHDEVSPFPVQIARRAVETELQQSIDEVFVSFDDVPLAAASMAQVHRAVTRAGEQVVLKVQRPDIARMIDSDMEILWDLARLVRRALSEDDLWDPVAIVEEFRGWIVRELDFLQEARNIDRFGRNFRTEHTVRVPKVFWELSSARLLTMEYIDALPVLALEQFEMHGIDARLVARNGARAMLKQIFQDGFFHGDPHPGNIKVLPGSVIVPLDFGLMGRLDQDMLVQVGKLLLGLVSRDAARIDRVLVGMGLVGDAVDRQALKRDLGEFIDRYYHVPLKRIDTRHVLREAIDMLTRHRIRLPRDLYLMVKSLVVVEDICRALDPGFDIISAARPYVNKIMLRSMDMKRLLRDGSMLLDDMRALLDALPENLRHILMKVRRGDLGVNLQHHGLEVLIREIDRSSNRISFSMIIASLIVGSSLIMQLDKGPLLFGFPVFGLVGYSFAALLGAGLVISIVRSGRM